MIESLFAGNSFALAAAAIALTAAALLISFVYRSVTRRGLQIPRNGKPRPVRLGVVDVFRLDGRRQLVIVRRDSVEHLIMIGGPNDLLIESQITRSDKRESRNYRESKVRDKEFRDWEPRETALPGAGDHSPSPAEDAPVFSRHSVAFPSPAGEEQAAFPTGARREGRHPKAFGQYDDAVTFGEARPSPANESAFDFSAETPELPSTQARRGPDNPSAGVKLPAREAAFTGYGRPAHHRERPTLRPVPERQAPTGALTTAEAPQSRPQGLLAHDGTEAFPAEHNARLAEAAPAATQAGEDPQASLSLTGGQRAAPRTGDEEKTAISLVQEIARILGRERR